MQQNQIHLPPAALHAANETRKFFVEAIEPPVEQQVELSANERTAEGFIELAWEHLDLQRALHLDWRYQEGLTDNFQEWPEKESAQARDYVIELNLARDHDKQLDIDKLSTAFLLRAIEPNWTEQLGDEQIAQWPEELQTNLLGLREVDTKLRVLSQDESLRSEAQEIEHDRANVMKAAIGWVKTEAKVDDLVHKITEAKLRQGRSDRPLTKAEERRIGTLEGRMAQLKAQQGSELTSADPSFVQEVAQEIERRDRKQARREYEHGLVVTDSMEHVIEEALPSLIKGSPVLFVGETGGAKTALAEYLSREYIGKEPELVSGYSDVNGYQLMGKTGLSTKDGATVSEFVEGPVVRAMEAGVPLILDEVNAMPPEFLKRLNKIMQLRPGQSFKIQEDSGREVVVKQGFAVMATANEKSKRYKGVHDLSSEFVNRFAADTYRIHYPDYDIVVGQPPIENMRIAYGAVCDEVGEIQTRLPDGQLTEFVKAAHMTQRLYAGHISEGLEQSVLDAVGTDRLADEGATGLDETVLAPRTMAAILEKVRDSNGTLSLERVLGTWLEGVKSPHDRKVLKTVLGSRGLLAKAESN